MLAAPELSPHWTWYYFAYFGGVCSVALKDHLLSIVVDESGLLLSTFSNERERDLTVRMNPVDEVEVIEDIAVILSSDFQ